MRPSFAICLSLALAAFSTSRAEGADPTGSGTLGLGGRISWTQNTFGDPSTWIDGHAVFRPLPRLFVAGAYGRATETRRGSGPDTSRTESRWELTAGIVILPGTVTGYIPATWRNVSQRDDWAGSATWTEIGTGLGALVPVRDWLQVRAEGLWSEPTSPHNDCRLGAGRQIDESHIELSLGFLAYLR